MDAPRQFDLCTVRDIHGRIECHVVCMVEREVVGNVAEHVVADIVPACEQAMTRGRREDVNF